MNGINDFSSLVNQLAPAALAQFIKDCSRFRMLKENLRASINAETNP
jgi:hypothetical protein